MGISISKCVRLHGEKAYLEEAYTVVRTGGEEQTGWLLTEKYHRCFHMSGRERPASHALLKEKGWAVHLHNGDPAEEDPEAHACGWRRLGTFWPTRLTGDAAAIEAWTAALKARLEELAKEQGLPHEYHEHTCSRGDGMCSGCFWEKDAAQKKEERAARAAAAEPPSALDTALEALGAKPYHPVYAPLEPVVAEPKERGPEDVEREFAELKERLAEARAIVNPTRRQVRQRNALEEDFVKLEHEYTQIQIWTLEPREVDLQAAYRIALHSERDADWSKRCGAASDKLVEVAEELSRLRDELEKMPRAPAYAELPPLEVRPLPEPMDAETRRLVLGSFKSPEKPTQHGCGYADSDCPWAICYACEYERNPAQYERKIRHSELIQLISAYWRDPRKGEMAKGWSNEALEEIVAELDRPRQERVLSDEQVCDLDFYSITYEGLLAALRKLNGLVR